MFAMAFWFLAAEDGVFFFWGVALVAGLGDVAVRGLWKRTVVGKAGTTGRRGYGLADSGCPAPCLSSILSDAAGGFEGKEKGFGQKGLFGLFCRKIPSYDDRTCCKIHKTSKQAMARGPANHPQHDKLWRADLIVSPPRCRVYQLPT